MTVAGTDLRDEVLPGTRIGAFPITSSTVVELTCGGQFIPTVVVQSTQVRADGRLYISLRGFDQDLGVGLTAPDGVRLVTEPEAPVPVPGGDDAPLTTIPVSLEVTTCTVAAQQLDAGNQVVLDIGDQRFDAARPHDRQRLGRPRGRQGLRLSGPQLFGVRPARTASARTAPSVAPATTVEAVNLIQPATPSAPPAA